MTDHDESTRAVDRIADAYVEDFCVLDPLAATYFGVPGHDHELPDLSPDGYDAREGLARRALAAMLEARPADDREQVARDAFVERLNVTIDQYDAKTPQSQISVISSELHSIRGVFDLMSTDGDEAWSDIDARLAAIPDAVDQYRATLIAHADAGSVSAKRQLDAVAGQVRAWTGQEGESGDFFHDLVSHAELGDALTTQLMLHAREASAAFAGFGEFLENDLHPRGRDEDGVGRDRYAPESRSFLGAVIDLDETYDWGWQELKRIEDEMRRGLRPHRAGRRRRRGRRGTRLRPRPRDLRQGELPSLDAGPRRQDDRRDGRRPLRHPRARPADRVLHSTDQRRRHLLHGSERGLRSRPGRMWWAVPDGVTDFSTWREVTTVYHEGVPGHHLQVAQTAYRRTCSTAGSARCAGCQGTARGGRCTPSG